MNDQNPPYDVIEPEVIEPGGISREQALEKVRTPAVCLIVFWALTLLNYLSDILFTVTGLRNQMLESLSTSVPPEFQPQIEQLMNQNPAVVYSLSCFSLVIGILALIGAVKMLRLQTYGLALTGAIISVIPCFGPCCCCSLLLIPFGIWALVVLSDAQVKQHFM
jgi:hypothetical protein